MKRVCVFIDGSNFYHNLKSLLGEAKVDFHKLGKKIARWVADELEEDTELVRVYYYNSPVDSSAFPDSAKGQQRFFDALRHTKKLELKLGRLERRHINCANCRKRAEIVCDNCGNKQAYTYEEKEVDVTIAVDMIMKAETDGYDVGVLVSDDGDFASVLKGVKHFRKTVVFAGFGRTRALIAESDLDLFFKRDFFADTGL